MARGSYPDASHGGLHCSFCKQLRECVLPGEEFCPLRCLYLGQRRRDSLYLFFLVYVGVPRSAIIRVSQLLATKARRERVCGVHRAGGTDGLAGRRALETGLHDCIVRAVRLCEPRLARYPDRRALGARAVAHPSHRPHRSQRDDLWLHLNFSSRWHCVRVCLLLCLSTFACLLMML